MSVQQFQQVTQSLSTTITNTDTGIIAIPRPTSKAATSNTIDFVAGNPQTEEDFLAGLAMIKLSTTFTAATVFLVKLVKVAATVEQAETTLFPNGSPASGDVVVYEDATGIATNDALISPLLSNLTIIAGESFKISLKNSSGGSLTGTVSCHYELGRNQADYSLRDEA